MKHTLLFSLILLSIPELSAASGSPPAALSNGFRIPGAPNALGRPTAGLIGIGFDSAGSLYMAGTVFGKYQVPNVTILGPFAAASVGGTELPHMFVMKINVATRNIDYVTEIGGSSYDVLQAAAVSKDGTVFLAGTTNSTDFPTTTGSFQPTSMAGTGFVLGLDPSGQHFTYSTYLQQVFASEIVTGLAVDGSNSAYIARSDGGILKVDDEGSTVFSTGVNGAIGGIALDSSGRIGIGGSTCSASIAVTGAPPPAGSPPLQCPDTSYFAVLDPGASNILHSGLLSAANYDPVQVAFDGAGNLYLSGESFDYYKAPQHVALTKVSSAGAIVYTQILAGSGVESVGALWVLADGTAVVGGVTSSPDFATLDTLQPCWMDLPHTPFNPISSSGYLTVVDPSGKLVFSTFLGGTGYVNQPVAIAPGTDAKLFLAGNTTSTDFPGDDLFSQPDSDQELFGVELDLSAVVHGKPAPSCMVNAASGVAMPIAAGTITTIHGTNLGPAEGVSFTLDQNGILPFQLAGTQVTVNGVASPMVFAQADQIIFITPRGLTGTSANICITATSGSACLNSVLVLPGDPGLFLLPSGSPAIFNQDWTMNSQTNPAPRGGVVAMFGTGFGPEIVSIPDGTLTPIYMLSWVTGTVEATLTIPPPPCFGGNAVPCPQPTYVPMPIEFAGASPTLVNGVDQLNIVIPTSLSISAVTQFPVQVTILAKGGPGLYGAGIFNIGVWVK